MEQERLWRRFWPSFRVARSGIPGSGWTGAVVLGAICLSGMVRCSSEPSFDGKSLSFWLAQLEDSQSDKRLEAGSQIDSIGPAAQAALPLLEDLVRNEKNVGLRFKAIYAYGSVARGQDARIRPLVEALVDRQDAFNRVSAATALAWFSEAAVPGLVEALVDPDPRLRLEAARSLGRIGPAAVLAVPALTAAAKDSHHSVAEAARIALGYIQKTPAPKPEPPAPRTLMEWLLHFRLELALAGLALLATFAGLRWRRHARKKAASA